MNTKNKEKSIEERLSDIEKWQEDNIEKLQADFIELKKDYMEAPGNYNPNINEQLRSPNALEIYTTEDYRLDMGNKGEFSREILNEDYIDALIDDSFKVTQTPDRVRLIGSELKNELKALASLIKVCERYIKNNPNVVVAFKDGLMALRRQYAESISHLQQVHKLPVSDFITNEAILRWNLEKFKESLKETSEMAYDFTYDFKELTSDFIEWD